MVLVDGWHRLAALAALGRSEVEAEVVDASEGQALWLASAANLAHGLPLKRKELRRVFGNYVKARQHTRGTRLKSYRDIAQELGGVVTHTTVRNWMIKDHPRIAARMGGTEVDAPGGHREAPAAEGFADTALGALQQALAAFHGISNPTARGNVIEEAEAMVASMKTGGHWEVREREPWDSCDF